MPRTLALTALAAAALGAAALPATVASQEPADVAYRPGYFIGRTADRGKALVHIRGDRLTFWGQYVRIHCPGRKPGFLKVGEHGSWPMPADGRFSISGRGKGGAWELRGRATTEAVTGTLELKVRVRGDGEVQTCTSPRTRFTAPWRGPL
ncbi:MAG TPA: hypothetical protein VFR97_01815 [Capillimicrobium sp.]|nr:hypothetical protein [Capillimicrobium sp.]